MLELIKDPAWVVAVTGFFATVGGLFFVKGKSANRIPTPTLAPPIPFACAMGDFEKDSLAEIGRKVERMERKMDIVLDRIPRN